MEFEYTRKQYLEHGCNIRQYYGQCVTDGIKLFVLRIFSIDELKASYHQNQHFNTKITPLETWTEMAESIPKVTMPPDDFWGHAINTKLCLFKEAARQLVEMYWELHPLRVIPDPNCKFCRGGGLVYESEKAWGADCQRENYCTCFEDQIPEDFDGEIILPSDKQE